MSTLEVTATGSAQYHLRCANIVDGETGAQCSNTAKLGACGTCGLVAYCNEVCHAAHWQMHKVNCKSAYLDPKWKPTWERENRRPTFLVASAPSISHGPEPKYLWGNIQAIDVLNLPKNEGLTTERKFRLLFAASEDLRNVITTIVAIPKSSKATVTCIINDIETETTSRNIILLLIALTFEPAEAANIMVHLWYSALIPGKLLQRIREKVLPLIQDVCQKIENKPASSFQAKRFSINGKTLRVVLLKEQWLKLPAYLDVPDGLTVVRVKEIRDAVVCAPHRLDHVHRHLYNLSPRARTSMMRFRERGVLFPFGAPTNEFDTPNPTFFQTADTWPMKDNADPTQGWSDAKFSEKAHPIIDDVYGNLYLYLLETFHHFCSLIQGSLDVTFEVYQVHATDLPQFLEGQQLDRIECSNTIDKVRLGVSLVLETFGPLLKPKAVNPHAVILGYFLNDVKGAETSTDKKNTMTRHVADLCELDSTMTANFFHYIMDRERFADKADVIAMATAFDLLSDWKMLFERYNRSNKLDEVAAEFQLRRRTQNSVVEMWPYKIDKDENGKFGSGDFKKVKASKFSGGEMFVEWCRAY